MPVTIIANVDRRQTRVAIMEGTRLLELKHETEEDVVGNIYLGKVTDVVPGLDACFINVGIEKNAFLHVSDAIPDRPRGPHRRTAVARVADVVKSRDEFLVQVTKGPLDTKGARATRHISLAGRCLVLTTDGDKVGVSKKIEDDHERRRLRDIASKLRPEGFGLIVRTRGEGAHADDFERDIKFLTKVWKALEAKAKQSKAPALIHADISLVFAVVRDIFNAEVHRMVIDDKLTYDQVLNLLQTTAPELRDRVEFYRGEKPIFEHFGVEQEIERAIQSKVPLAHGGHLNIESTIALTTIDVNSGKFTGAGNLEETVFKTNLDACQEVARQLRLRDIGGIIVIDFIDMDKPRHRKEVTTALRNAFADDRMRTRIMHLTRLGLIEMTRKRTGESLVAKLQTKCPCCVGSGQILAPETVAQRAINSVRSRLVQEPDKAVLFLADPACTLALLGPHGTEAAALEQELGVPVFARATYETHPEVCTISLGDPAELTKAYRPFHVDDIVEITPQDALVGQHGAMLALVQGCVLEVPEISSRLEAAVKIRLTCVENSYLRGTPSEGLPEKPASKSRRRRKKSAGVKRVAPLPTEGEPVPVLSWAEEAMEAAEAEPASELQSATASPVPEEKPSSSRSRRRRGGRRRSRKPATEETTAPATEATPVVQQVAPAEVVAETVAPVTPPDTFGMVPGYIPPKKRPRHGGRQQATHRTPAPPEAAPEPEAAPTREVEAPPAPEPPAPEPKPAPAKRRRRRSPRRKAETPAPEAAPEGTPEATSVEPPAGPPARQPRRRSPRRKTEAPAPEAAPEVTVEGAPVKAPAQASAKRPRRRSPRKKTEAPTPEAASEASSPAAPVETPAAPAPAKRPRRRSARRKKTEETPPDSSE